MASIGIVLLRSAMPRARRSPPNGGLSGKDLREGLAAVVSIKVGDPKYSNQAKCCSTLITALGTGVGDEKDIERLRCHKILIMTVDAEEHVLVRDRRGVSLTKIGDFIDRALIGVTPVVDLGARSSRHGVATRTILTLTDGASQAEVAGHVGLRRRIVRKWAERFVERGPLGLEDAPRSARLPRFSPDRGPVT